MHVLFVRSYSVLNFTVFLTLNEAIKIVIVKEDPPCMGHIQTRDLL